MYEGTFSTKIEGRQDTIQLANKLCESRVSLSDAVGVGLSQRRMCTHEQLKQNRKDGLDYHLIQSSICMQRRECRTSV